MNMNPIIPLTTFDQIGIAVTDVDQAVAFMNQSFGIEFLTMGLSVIILAVWITAGLLGFQSSRAGVLIILLTIVNLAILFRCGIWIDISQPTPTYDFLLNEKGKGLYYRPHPGEGYEHRAVIRQIRQSFLEPSMGKIFYRFEFINFGH